MTVRHVHINEFYTYTPFGPVIPPTPVATVVPSKKIGHHQFLSVRCFDPGYACSTATIGNFAKDPSFDEFCLNIIHCLKQRTDGYPVHMYSFLIASTTDHEYYKTTRGCLNELGFLSTEDSYNEKNKTHVMLHTVSVTELIKKLKEFGHEFKESK